jgi:hypothetical protein
MRCELVVYSLASLPKSVHEEKTDKYEMSETDKPGIQIPEDQSKCFGEGIRC